MAQRTRTHGTRNSQIAHAGRNVFRHVWRATLFVAFLASLGALAAVAGSVIFKAPDSWSLFGFMLISFYGISLAMSVHVMLVVGLGVSYRSPFGAAALVLFEFAFVISVALVAVIVCITIAFRFGFTPHIMAKLMGQHRNDPVSFKIGIIYSEMSDEAQTQLWFTLLLSGLVAAEVIVIVATRLRRGLRDYATIVNHEQTRTGRILEGFDGASAVGVGGPYTGMDESNDDGDLLNFAAGE